MGSGAGKPRRRMSIFKYGKERESQGISAQTDVFALLGYPQTPRGRKQSFHIFRKELHMSFFRKKNTPQETPVNIPPKPNRKRSERLSLGLTLEEKNMISDGAKEAGMSRTDFVIASVKGTKVVVITALPEVLLELSRQGNNLNQIARCLNQRGYVNYETIEKTCQSCRDAYEQLTSLVDRYDVKLKRMEDK